MLKRKPWHWLASRQRKKQLETMEQMITRLVSMCVNDDNFFQLTFARSCKSWLAKKLHFLWTMISALFGTLSFPTFSHSFSRYESKKEHHKNYSLTVGTFSPSPPSQTKMGAIIKFRDINSKAVGRQQSVMRLVGFERPWLTSFPTLYLNFWIASTELELRLNESFQIFDKLSLI